MSQRTVLITIGRLPKALDFARSFHAVDWRVIVAEPFRSHLTGASNTVAASRVVPPPSAGKEAYLDALLELIQAERVDLVLPLSEETMHVAHLHGRLPEGVRLFAPLPDTVLALHDKERFAAETARLGLSVPRTARLGTPEAETLAATTDYVVKPVFSCSGRGIRFGKAGTSPGAPNQAEREIVQARIRGAHLSTFALAHEGRVRVNVVYRGLVMSGTVAVAFERVEQPAVDAWVHAFAERTGHTGFLSFDFILDQEGEPWAIECNPRVTSGVHFIETDDLALALLDPSAPLRFRDARTMQQFYPTLTEVQNSMFKPGFKANLSALRTAKDVTWSVRDPIPFVTMPVTAFRIIADSIRTQRTFGEVSTEDISWYESPPGQESETGSVQQD